MVFSPQMQDFVDVIKVVIDLVFKVKDGNELRDALKEGCFGSQC